MVLFSLATRILSNWAYNGILSWVFFASFSLSRSSISNLEIDYCFFILLTIGDISEVAFLKLGWGIFFVSDSIIISWTLFTYCEMFSIPILFYIVLFSFDFDFCPVSKSLISRLNFLNDSWLLSKGLIWEIDNSCYGVDDSSTS